MRLAAGLILGAGALYGAGAHAGSVQVDASGCADVVHIKADDAPLGEVLAKAAAAMGFRLDAKVELAEKVTVDRKGAPERVLKQLMAGKNLVLQTAPNPKCGGKDRITTVWVLPTGQDAPRRPAPAAAPAEPGSAALPQMVVEHPRPRGTRKSMSREEWQQMKRDYRAGKVKADPETGKPVPVEKPADEPPAEAQ